MRSALIDILRDPNAREDVRIEASSSLVGIDSIEVDRARNDLLVNPEHYNVSAVLRSSVIHDTHNFTAPELIDTFIQAAKPGLHFADRLNALSSLEGKVSDPAHLAALARIIQFSNNDPASVQHRERPEICLAAIKAIDSSSGVPGVSELTAALYSALENSKSDKIVSAAFEKLAPLRQVEDSKHTDALIAVLDTSRDNQNLSRALTGLRGSTSEAYPVGMYRFLSRCEDPNLQVQALADVRELVTRALPHGITEIGTPMRNLRNMIIGLQYGASSNEVMVGIRDTLALFKDQSLSDSLYERTCKADTPAHIKVCSAETLALQHTPYSAHRCQELVFMDSYDLDGDSGYVAHFDFRPEGRFSDGLVSATIGSVIQNAALHGLVQVTDSAQRLNLLLRVRDGQFADGHMAIKATGLAATEAEAGLLAEILQPEGRGGLLGAVAYQVGQVYPPLTVQAAIAALSYTWFRPGVEALNGVLKHSPSEEHRFLAAGMINEDTIDGMTALLDAKRNDKSKQVSELCGSKLRLIASRAKPGDKAA